MGFWSRVFRNEPQIDDRLRELLGELRPQFVTHSVELPEYRYGDLFRAINSRLKDTANLSIIESEVAADLTNLLHTSADSWENRDIGKAGRRPFATGPDTEEFLPKGCFWVYCNADFSDAFVIRLSLNELQGQARLESAAPNAKQAETLLTELIEASSRDSVYRGKILNLAYSVERRDEYGDVEKAERFRVLFSPTTPVEGADIVLSDQHMALLRRNIIDLAIHRDLLRQNGVPPKRGVLLHGPPGTGKTYACRHICHEMPKVTHIFLTGSSLANVGAVFSLARLFQPSVVFIEDADLMFANRDVNMNTGILGELMDQMDGLKVNEAISVIMTTNAIDRMEEALKDRPGRISQCIFMGAPDTELRKRFIFHQLKNYNLEKLDLAALTETSDGASQAFIKEWIFRAVQIGCERLTDGKTRVELEQSDFIEAMTEMQLTQDRSAGKIIGFRP